MRVEKISDNNFGTRITDNMTFQMIGHFWVKRFSSKEVNDAVQAIRGSASDAFEVTFQNFYIGNTSDVWIKRVPSFVEKMEILYAEVKKGRHKKGEEGRVLKVLSPREVAEKIVQKVKESIVNVINPEEKKYPLSIVNNHTYKRLIEYWERRSSKKEISEALDKIASSAGGEYSLLFKKLVYENPHVIWLEKADEAHYEIKFPMRRKIVKRGKKPKIPREALSPMKVAESIYEKVTEYLQNGFVKSATRGSSRGIRKKKTAVSSASSSSAVIQDSVAVIKGRRGRPSKGNPEKLPYKFYFIEKGISVLKKRRGRPPKNLPEQIPTYTPETLPEALKGKFI